MNISRTLLAAAALSLAAIGAAQADEYYGGEHVIQVQGTRSRAEVSAELAQFRKDGVDPWSMTYDPLATFHGTATRSDVRQDYVAHRASVAAMDGEDSGSLAVVQKASSTPSVLARLAR